MAAPKRSLNLILLVSVATAIIGGVLVAIFVSNSGGGTTPAALGPDVQVLVAKKAIPAGTTGAPLNDAVEVRTVKASARLADALVALTDLQDRTTAVQISQGDQLRSTYFAARTLRGTSISVPEGTTALAITVDTTPGGAGYIGRDDFVDVYGLYTSAADGARPAPGTLTPPGNGTIRCPDQSLDPKATNSVCTAKLLLSNVRVLERSFEQAPIGVATPPTTVAGQQASVLRPAGTTTITFLVAAAPGDAEKLVFFATYEKIYLALKPRNATTGEPAQPASVTPGRTPANAVAP